jgi:exonuclease III
LLGTNVRSLRKYWDIFLAESDSILSYIDVILFNEIKVNQEEVKLFGINGFNSISKCRQSGEGGGILCLYRDKIKVEELEADFQSAELLLLKFFCNGETIIIMAFYRPPNLNVNRFIDELDDLLNLEFLKNEKNIVMIGDINLCYITHMYGADRYLDILYSHGIVNMIDKPIRVGYYNNNLVSTCLDHINVRSSDQVHKAFVIEEKIADYYWIGQ